MSKRLTEAEKLFEKLERKLNWLVLLQEFNALSNMADAHRNIFAGIQRAANEDVTIVESIPENTDDPELLKKRNFHLNQFRSRMMSADIFDLMVENDLQALSQVNKKITSLLARKYPILAREKREEPVQQPLKCEVCGKPAVVAKDGKASCRKHFSQIFREYAKEEKNES